MESLLMINFDLKAAACLSPTKYIFTERLQQAEVCKITTFIKTNGKYFN